MIHLTVPNLSTVVLVSSVRGVDANTQTFPSDSLMAVERPPQGRNLKRVKGLNEADHP